MASVKTRLKAQATQSAKNKRDQKRFGELKAGRGVSNEFKERLGTGRRAGLGFEERLRSRNPAVKREAQGETFESLAELNSKQRQEQSMPMLPSGADKARQTQQEPQEPQEKRLLKKGVEKIGQFTEAVTDLPGIDVVTPVGAIGTGAKMTGSELKAITKALGYKPSAKMLDLIKKAAIPNLEGRQASAKLETLMTKITQKGATIEATKGLSSKSINAVARGINKPLGIDPSIAKALKGNPIKNTWEATKQLSILKKITGLKKYSRIIYGFVGNSVMNGFLDEETIQNLDFEITKQEKAGNFDNALELLEIKSEIEDLDTWQMLGWALPGTGPYKYLTKSSIKTSFQRRRIQDTQEETESKIQELQQEEDNLNLPLDLPE